MTTVVLMGAPADIGASVPGCRMGPDALRVAGLAQALRAQDAEVQDWGNLPTPAPGALPPGAAAAARGLDEVVGWNRAIDDAVTLALGAGAVPLLMGGDHSLAIGSISAVARHLAMLGCCLPMVSPAVVTKPAFSLMTESVQVMLAFRSSPFLQTSTPL